MKISEAISELLDGVSDAYKDDLTRFNTTQQASNSIRKEVKDTSGKLYGAHYLYQLKHGRRPGKFPPISAIIEWIRAKRIQPQDITERSLAFLIARKIARQGTNIFQRKVKGLNIDDKLPELLEKFKQQVKVEVLNIFN